MPPGAENPTPKILVIDDNEANRALATSTLEDEDYQVILATDGVGGIAAFERERPDCVILDVRMPGMDGFEVCTRLRALPGGPETPILFFTALRDVDTFDRAQLAGGDDFLTKPIRPTELVVRVQSALKLSRMGSQLREHYDLLKEQRDALLRLHLQKERLTAFIVHDLKNPVNSIDLNAQLQLRQKDLPASVREAAARIRSDAQQLNRMILNLLDMARADEGQLLPKRATIDLRGLVAKVLAENRANAEGRGVALAEDLAVAHAYADEDMFHRVLTNLVENAIRHAPPQTSVRVSARGLSGDTEIRVADAGTGIPLEMQSKIFDPFVQLESPGEPGNRQGRGLGLAFCRLAIEAHGGVIWVENATPGAAFCVRLPRAS